MNILQKISDLLFSRNDAEIEDTEENTDTELDMLEEGDVDFGQGVFINSLDDFSADDVVLNDAAVKAAKVTPIEIIRRIMFWVCLGTFVISFSMLIENLIAKQKGDEIYAQLENEFLSSGFSFGSMSDFTPEEGAVKYLAADREAKTTLSITARSEGAVDENTTSSGTQSGGYNEELEKMRAGLSSLAQINPDVYGWIAVDGTQINYPIVQGEDNDYYLDHAYTGDYLPIGSIFADYRNNESVTKNYNTILYGHNITSGSMFHDVTKFFEDEYFDNSYIYIYTTDGIFVYEPFSVYETRYDYNYFKTSFKNAEEFIAFAEEVRDNSSMEKDIEFNGNDRIITLSTCTNGAYYSRYALHAKLIKTIVD